MYIHFLRTPQTSIEWLASYSFRPVPFNHESFTAITALGKGKFGLVFLAKHNPSNKHFAIKYIPKQIINECQCSSRLQQAIFLLLISMASEFNIIIHIFPLGNSSFIAG
jgi:serine/threonine protein kinase